MKKLVSIKLNIIQVLVLSIFGILQSNAQLKTNLPSSYNGDYIKLGVSPSVASIQTQIDNNISFTGALHTSIPLYIIDYNKFKLPIVLSYIGGSGAKVNELAGSTGLGWKLSNTGVVTLVESKKWKNFDPGEITYSQYDILRGKDWDSKTYLNTLLKPKNYALLYKTSTSLVNKAYNSLSGNVYSFSFNGFSGEIYFDENEKPRFRSSNIDCMKVEFFHAADLFEYGQTDECSIDTDGNQLLAKNSLCIGFPRLDNYQDVDIIRKTNPYYNISTSLKESPIRFDPSVISQIIFTHCDGTKYIFGGVKNTIEFSRKGHNPDLKEFSIGDRENIYPTSWYLSKVILPNSEQILFQYQRGNVIYNSEVYYDLKDGIYGKSTNNIRPAMYSQFNLIGTTVNSTLINPVYLVKIQTPKELIDFSYSPSKQLTTNLGSFSGFNNCKELPNNKIECDYNNDKTTKKSSFFFGYVYDIRYANFKNFDYMPLQLDKMNVQYNKDQAISFDFSYTIDTKERLKLIKLSSLGKNMETKDYFFTYNKSKLPDYESFLTDDFGFYNFKPYASEYVSSAFDMELHTDKYNNFKNSNNERIKYIEWKSSIQSESYPEILTEIKYPTGGIMKFEYESNMYGAIAKNYPFVVVKNSGDSPKATGGVRIKSIKGFDSDGKLLTSKKYKYLKKYEKGQNVSSGILTHMPTYFDVMKTDKFVSFAADSLESAQTGYTFSDLNFFRWSSNDIYPANRLRGNHITYSEVTEIDDLDNSFIIYKYKNFDNGYHDKPVINVSVAHDKKVLDENGENKEFWKNYDVISMGLERGQLLSKTFFNTIENTFTKVKEYQYSYNDKPNRFDDFIRVINRYDRGLYDSRRFPFNVSWAYIASKIYTYTPYLQREIEIDYNGSDSIVKRNISYKYNDIYKLPIEKEEQIRGVMYKTKYMYAFDFNQQLDDVYKAIVEKHMISSVILEEKYLNTEKIFSQKTNYKKYYPLSTDIITRPVFPMSLNKEDLVIEWPKYEFFNLPVVGSIENQYKGSNWEKEIEFLEYDSKFNPLNFKDKLGKETCYIWGYNKSLPIWVISNVSYSTVKDVLGDKIAKIANAATPTAEDLLAVNKLLKESPEFREAFIEHYLYDPMRGLIYKEDATGIKEYYEYDGFGRLKRVQDNKKNTVIEYEYNYKQ